MVLLVIRLLLTVCVAGLLASLLGMLVDRNRGTAPRPLWRWLGGTSFAVLMIIILGIYFVAAGIH